MLKETDLPKTVVTHQGPLTKGLFLKTLLVKAHGSFSSAYLNNLPPNKEEYNQAFLKSFDEKTHPFSFLYQEERTLSLIHYSWLVDPLKSFSSFKRREIIKTLSEPQKKGLSSIFNEKIKAPPSPFSYYLKKHLFSSLDITSHTPIEHLPKTPQNALLNLSKETLVKVIEYLSLYDLAIEIKTVIAKEQLTDIFSILSKDQQNFLKNCMQKKDRYTKPKMNLSKVDIKKSKEGILRELHLRGLFRLSGSIAHLHKDFIWTLSRILDVGRGSKLLKIVSSFKAPLISQTYVIELDTVLNHLLEGSKS